MKEIKKQGWPGCKTINPEITTQQTAHQYVGDAVSQVTKNGTVASHHYVESAGKRDTFQPCVL